MRVGYIVIFTSKRNLLHAEEYEKTATFLEQEVQKIPGFVKMESVRASDGNGITISYWESLTGIEVWKRNAKHMKAKARAGAWYEMFDTKIWKIEDSWNP